MKKRYTGRIIVDTGYAGARHEDEYDFVCEPEDFEQELQQWSEQAVWNCISTYTEDETEEDVEEDE